MQVVKIEFNPHGLSHEITTEKNNTMTFLKIKGGDSNLSLAKEILKDLVLALSK